MGTRSLVTVEANGDEIITLYRHWDGYPSVAGRAIYDALKGCRVVNGLCGNEDFRAINGIGRLACELIAKAHKDAEFDVLPPSRREVGEEYVYTIYVTETDGYGVPVGAPMLRVTNGPMTAFGFGGENCTNVLYDGPLDDFDPDMEAEAA